MMPSLREIMLFYRGYGNNRIRDFSLTFSGRENNRGNDRDIDTKFENSTRGGNQFNFCKVKRHKGSSDGIETIYQSKLDSSLHSDVNNKEGVCYFVKSRLQTALGTNDGQKVVVLRDTCCTGDVVRSNLVSQDQSIGKESPVSLMNETM